MPGLAKYPLVPEVTFVFKKKQISPAIKEQVI